MQEAKITKFAKEMADELLEGKAPKTVSALTSDEILTHMDAILLQVENTYSNLVAEAVEEAGEESEVEADDDWWEEQ